MRKSGIFIGCLLAFNVGLAASSMLRPVLGYLRPTGPTAVPSTTGAIRKESLGDNEWSTWFCMAFSIRHTEDTGTYDSSIMESCKADAIMKSQSLLNRNEHVAMHLLATLCVESWLTHLECLNLLQLMKRYCWNVPQVIVFLTHLRRTSAVSEIYMLARDINPDESVFMHFNDWLNYRLVPKLNASLCAFEIATAEDAAQVEVYRNILVLYKIWREEFGYKSPLCDCSEVLTMCVSIFVNRGESVDAEVIKDTYRAICMTDDAKSNINWTVTQLRVWRSKTIKPKLDALPLSLKTTWFPYLSMYGKSGWLENAKSFTERENRLMEMFNGFYLHDVKMAAFSAGFSVEDITRVFVNSNTRRGEYTHCRIRIINEMFLNPKYSPSSDPKFWHRQIDYFSGVLYNLMRMVISELSTYPLKGLGGEKATGDCETFMWYFLRIQDLYYSLPWTIYDLEFFLRERQFGSMLNSAPNRDPIEVEDAYLCMRTIAYVEVLAGRSFAPNSADEQKFNNHRRQFMEDMLKWRNRYLCYKHFNYLEKNAIVIFYETNAPLLN